MKNGRSIPLSEIQKEVIVGTVLGDASLTKSRHNIKTACVRFGHSIHQKDYCLYKWSFLKNISNKPPKEYTNFRKDKNEYYTKISYDSIFTKELFDLYQIFYRDKKSIPENISDLLTKRSLAFWYMDDGSIETIKDKRNGKIYYIRNAIRIHTNGFTRKESELLANVLYGKFGLKFRIKKVKCHGIYTILYTKSRKTIEKFIAIVSPFICDSMKYKIKTSYVKPIKNNYSKDKSIKLMRKLNIKERKDFFKYRKGKKLYSSICWYYKSPTNARKIIERSQI